MSDADDLLAWVERAEEDYVVATDMLRRQKPLAVTACFHAQQCAEKYLKAVLVRQGQPFPKTHDLLTLHTLCVQAGILLGFTATQLGTLSSYAVQVRYPVIIQPWKKRKKQLRLQKLYVKLYENGLDFVDRRRSVQSAPKIR